jgi:hypothetical protein
MNIFVGYLDIIWSSILILLPYLKLCGKLGQNWQGGFCHSSDVVHLCLLLSEIDYSPLRIESFLQLFDVFCA